MLLLQAAALSGGAFAASGNADHFLVAAGSTQTAGTAFTVTITAQDSMNRTSRSYFGAHCLTFTGPANSPNGTPPTYPAQGACATGQSAVTFTNGVASVGITLFAAGSNTLTVADPSIVPGTGSKVLTVNAAPASELTFTDQPIDTERNTPIYSSCVPDPELTTPCASTTDSPASSPVRVLAKDTYGNFATDSVSIKISPSGTTLGTATPDASGVASFGEQLSIGTVGSATLRAFTSATVFVDSNPIQIVFELTACDNKACKNIATTTGANVQRALNTIATSGDFFSGSTNVVLATSFFNTSAFSGRCGLTSFIGQGTEAKVEGTLGNTAPTTTMLIIMPKKTLQALGVSSRSADSFNVCVGATRLDGGTGTANAWTAEDAVGNLTPALAESPTSSTYWGLAADCSRFTDTANPCAALKTKNVGDVQAYFTSIGDSGTAAQIPSLMASSDLAIVIHKGDPWDGKGMLN